MPHTTPRGGGLSRDEPDDRLVEIRLDPGGGVLLGVAAYFADHHHRFGRRILCEQLQRVDEAGADERIAADPDAGRLAQPIPRELVDRLVGERTALRHDPDTPLPADVPRDDARLCLAGRNQSRAIGSDHPRPAATNRREHAHHVEHGNSFGDADGQGQLRVRGFEEGVCRAGGGHEDHRRVRTRPFHALRDGVEHGPAFVARPALARRHATDDRRAVGCSLLGVEGAFPSGEPLHEQAGVLVDQYSHLFSISRGARPLSPRRGPAATRAASPCGLRGG